MCMFAHGSLSLHACTMYIHRYKTKTPNGD